VWEIKFNVSLCSNCPFPPSMDVHGRRQYCTRYWFSRSPCTA